MKIITPTQSLLNSVGLLPEQRSMITFSIQYFLLCDTLSELEETAFSKTLRS